MKLTRKKAHRFCLRMWRRFAKTGETKDEYIFTDYELKHIYPEGSEPLNGCWYCEYIFQHNNHKCSSCLYYKKYGHCMVSQSFIKWAWAETPSERKKHAAEFLKLLEAIT